MQVLGAKPKTGPSNDEWQLMASQAAIAAAQRVVSKEGINSRAMIGSLGEVEWGWIVAAAIFAWINTKAKQAVTEGQSYDQPIRTMTHREPAPWEAGAVESTLPALAAIEGLDWAAPLGEWQKEQIVTLGWHMYRLVGAAIAARDEGQGSNIVQFSKEKTEREVSAANGGPLMSREELSDDIPF